MTWVVGRLDDKKSRMFGKDDKRISSYIDSSQIHQHIQFGCAHTQNIAINKSSNEHKRVLYIIESGELLGFCRHVVNGDD